MFVENGCTFYDKLYYLIKFFQGVPKLKSKLSIKAILEKVWQVKKIRSTKVYDKWWQKLNFFAFLPHGLGP